MKSAEETKKKISPDTGKRASTSPNINHEIHAFIIYILRQHASDLHPISPSEILQAIIEESRGFGFLGKEEKFNMTVKTLRGHLDAMYDFCYNDKTQIFEHIYLGKLHRYHLRSDYEERARKYPEAEMRPDYLSYEIPSEQIVSRYIEDNEDDERENDDYEGRNRKTFYSFTPMFSSQELLLLQSCVETNPYITSEDSRNIISKIKNLSLNSIYENIWEQKANRSPEEIVTSPNRSGRLMQNLTELIYHIELNHQIVIIYGMYDLDGQLVCKRFTEDGKPQKQIIDPVAVLWANGFCYLAAHTSKSKAPDDVIVYRVDRIMSISPSYIPRTKSIVTVDPDVVEYKKHFDSLEYLKQHPVMYSGDTRHITMLVKNSDRFPVANLLFDTFGRNIKILPFITDANAQKYFHCSGRELKEDRAETWFTVHLNHSVYGTILWAKQHIDIAMIISPKDVVESLTASVREGLTRYQ